MSKKAKSPVPRDEDFEQLDQELEAAMRALESVNERTVGVLQRVEQGAEVLEGAEEAPTADAPSEEPGAGEDAPTQPEPAAEG